MSQATVAEGSAPASEAGWRDVVAVVGGRVLERLRVVAGVVRPLGWMLMALTLLFAVVGSVQGWRELVVAAWVTAFVLAICALFLIGRTEYDVSLDLARTRVVVGVFAGSAGSRLCAVSSSCALWSRSTPYRP